ncbi:MAG: hypothetical protein VX278_06425 [Myxococcota bacterium]|nr:hypothetical protein [Myxococcota bacterium]
MMTGILTLTLLACGDKENQSFEDFQADYFHARQGEELSDACSSWYEDCVAAGYAEDDCGSRLEYCEDGEWTTGEDGEDREEGDREESDCDARAARAYEECISAGGSEEECRERVAQLYEDCENEERE